MAWRLLLVGLLVLSGCDRQTAGQQPQKEQKRPETGFQLAEIASLALPQAIALLHKAADGRALSPYLIKCCAELGTAALAGGAIDVLFRPLVARELLIRLRSVIKRWHVAMTPAPLTDGKLTQIETRILSHLEAQRGTPVATDELIEHLGGVHNIARLRLLIAGLRQKLHLHSPATSIATIRGVGYSLIVD